MAIALCRTALLYLIIIIGIRIMGKRQIGQLEPSELVMTLLISDLAAVPMQEVGIPLLNGVVPILTLLALTTIISSLSMKNIRFRELVCGRPSIVIRAGKILQSELRKTRLTLDELLEELRMQGYTDVSGIQYAILETNGQLSVFPFAAKQPASAELLGLSPQENSLPIVLINDGRLLGKNLQRRGLDRAWLNKQLKQHGISRVEDVFLLTVDEQNSVFFAPKEAKT